MTTTEKLLQLSKEMYMVLSNQSEYFGKRLLELEVEVLNNTVSDEIESEINIPEPVAYKPKEDIFNIF